MLDAAASEIIISQNTNNFLIVPPALFNPKKEILSEGGHPDLRCLAPPPEPRVPWPLGGAPGLQTKGFEGSVWRLGAFRV